MEIYLDKRAVRQIRLSAADALEEGDFETLREDLIDVFTEDQVEEIERRIDSGDITDFINEILDEWDSEDVEELFELLEGQLSEADIDLKYQSPEIEEEPEEEEDDEEDEEEEDDAPEVGEDADPTEETEEEGDLEFEEPPE